MYERKRINGRIKVPDDYVFPDGLDFGGEVLQPDRVSRQSWYCKFNMLDSTHWECIYILDNGEPADDILVGTGETPRKAFESLVTRWTILGGSETLNQLVEILRSYFQDDEYPSRELLEEIYSEKVPDELVMNNMGAVIDYDITDWSSMAKPPFKRPSVE